MNKCGPRTERYGTEHSRRITNELLLPRTTLKDLTDIMLTEPLEGDTAQEEASEDHGIMVNGVERRRQIKQAQS